MDLEPILEHIYCTVLEHILVYAALILRGHRSERNYSLQELVCKTAQLCVCLSVEGRL